MTTKLSVNAPGLVQHANAAQREIVRLQALLANTTEAHAQATTDAAAAKVTADALIVTIAALTA